MIDTLYQDAINRNLDDQVQRPGRVMQPQLGAFANFWRGLGGVPAGASNLSGNVSDLAWVDAQVLTGTGTMTGQGMFNLPTAEEKRQADAMAAKLKKDGPDANTELGDTFRTVARDYMPDAKTTGTAGLILGQGSSFLTQAVPLMAAGGPVPGAVLVGTTQGMQEADRLQEQGVDQATRMKAATVAGVGTGAAMLLPMSGPSALVRFGKGAAGGAGSYAAQTEAEKLVLQHAGYERIASQYDPLDPTALLLSGAVPGLLGAGLGHGSKPDVRMPDGIIPDKSAAAADLRVENDIAAVQRELARKGNTAEQNQILRDELEKLQAQRQAEPIKSAIEANPDLEAAARVQQTARAVDESRITPGDDLVGLEQHQQALEDALDQLGRGEPVQVVDDLKPEPAVGSPEWLAEYQRVKAEHYAAMEGDAPTQERVVPAARPEPALQARAKASPPEYIDTRGGPERFHGTSSPIESLSDDYAMSGDNRNIYGQGFYTTDAVDISAGYMRKGRGGQPTLYRVHERDVKMRDMDAPLTDADRDMLRRVAGEYDFEDEHSIIDNAKSLREWFDEFRANSRDFGLSRDSVQEIWDAIRTNFEEEGYRGYLHQGGDKTGNAPHSVKIYWFPEQDVAIQNARLADFIKAIDELRALREPESPPSSTTEQEGKGDPQPVTPPQPTAKADGATSETGTKPPQVSESAPAEAQGVASGLDAAVAALDQDMLVHLDGMENAVRLGDLMESLRAEAAATERDASLIEVAAQCALSFPSA